MEIEDYSLLIHQNNNRFYLTNDLLLELYKSKESFDIYKKKRFLCRIKYLNEANFYFCIFKSKYIPPGAMPYKEEIKSVFSISVLNEKFFKVLFQV